MKRYIIRFAGWSYRRILSPLLFRFDSEPIHEFFLVLGWMMGRVPLVPSLTRALLRVLHPSLHIRVAGIDFPNPIGLGAGFDHEARLPRIIGALGFGFESIGTVTRGAYGGNPYPRLKRLVKSRSILVNKGFKSSGMRAVLSRLSAQWWDVPIGISIGRTNTLAHTTHEEAVVDVVEAFKEARDSRVPFAYFELNISCPNLLRDISFYDPPHLTQLLTAVCALNLPKPLFIKMPISLSDDTTRALLDAIVRFPVTGVIFGNLQHDRSHPSFDKREVAQYAAYKDNWSGAPCQSRSDELVRIAYLHARGRLAVIGCGGVFSAEDAYRKIRLGASLVQIVSAMIFEGPQIASELNLGLSRLLARDGFKTVGDAVGVDAGK